MGTGKRRTVKQHFRYDKKTNTIVRIGCKPRTSIAKNILVGEAQYDGLRATDGADISSRKKHREYMRRNNLTTIDDFKSGFQKPPIEKITRDDIGRAIHKLEQGYRPNIQREGAEA